MKVKERKIYGLRNFMGLDKENKLLKVAPFRAVDGKNFIIDSQTLKTRPAFKYFDTPFKTTAEDISIVDFYVYGDIYVYVTNKGFKFKKDNLILSSITTPKLYDYTTSKDFSGFTPLFQEEKESLFIFGLDDIYVISNLIGLENTVENVIVYSLNNKPEINPFDFEDKDEELFFNLFNELPTPYVPTLYVNEKYFEDVNLLSNKSKYKLFNRSLNKAQEDYNVYELVTHFNPEKNEDFEVKIDFYKDKYKKVNIYPIFLGKEGENISSIDLSNAGALLNANNPIKLEKQYIAEQIFEYQKDSSNNITAVKEILGLTKDDFFNLKIKDVFSTVFDYVLNYIDLNVDENIMTNQVLKFEMPYERTTNIRDKDTDILLTVTKETATEDIYVQLKKFENFDFFAENKEYKQSEVINEKTLANPYPDEPTFTPVADDTYYIGGVNNGVPIPILKVNHTLDDFISMANVWLKDNQGTLTNNHKVDLFGYFYENKTTPTGTFVLDFLNSIPSTEKFVQYDNINSFPDLPMQETYLNINKILRLPGTSVVITDYEDLIKSAVIEHINFYLGGSNFSGNVVVRLQAVNLPNHTYRGVTLIINADYTSTPETYERRRVYGMRFEVVKNDNKVMDNVYNIEYNKEKGCFIFKCKDYFFNVNNEPPIDIEISFIENPDYNIIANSKFGITFGSENRLFLAGNRNYPNIDRFNVSNDLLGNNVKNQSYELSYFPSKNYRVLGGRGAINGYVLATDTLLYVTKEDYPNDQKLFIRNRTMDDNGIVGYNEYKTNINKSPINNKSIVRFYNDILILDKKGLYAVELGSNLLTDERLLRLRSGFINSDLIETIKNNKGEVFVFEDNFYMYIFIGDTIYVADSRYVSQNPNSIIENYNYEIVKWQHNVSFKAMKEINGKKILLDSSGKNIYYLTENNADDNVTFETNFTVFSSLDNRATYFNNQDINSYVDMKGVNFAFHNVNTYKVLAKRTADYLVENVGVDLYKISISNEYVFRNIKDGDIIYFKYGNVFEQLLVEDFENNNRESFIVETTTDITNNNNLYIDLTEQKLYPIIFFEDWNNRGFYRMLLSPYKKETVVFKAEDYDAQMDYITAIVEYDGDYLLYEFTDPSNLDTLVNIEKEIRLEWVSAVLDFGNNYGEKTMFRTNIYGTKQDKENWIKFGYRTMRRFSRFQRDGALEMMKDGQVVSINKGRLFEMVEASNNMSFDEIDFNLFSINTFSEFGSSLPTKENNFLYIQFLIICEGNVEINSFEFLYKLNRALKTIG